jgi:anti-sigma-K factor RskA
MTEEHVFDLLPAYALQILDEEDLIKVASHLSHCTICSQELESYKAAVNALALNVPIQTPAPDLKSKILRRVQAEASYTPAFDRNHNPTPASKMRPNWTERIFLGQAGLVFAVFAVFVILFLGINNYLLWQRVDDLEARVPGNNVQIVRLDGTGSAPQTVGYVIVFKNNRYGSLTVENAPVLNEDQQYQIWLMKNGERISGGVFSVNDSGYGVLQVYSKEPLEVYDSFGITIEPVGGSPAPTGEKILGGGL